MNIQTQVYKDQYKLDGFGVVTKYTVKDNNIPVGFVDLKDKPNGVEVMFIKNMNPSLYKNFGSVADQIEVEHCMQRGLDKFEITSNAGLNSHALHYKRGKRFYDKQINQLVKYIIKATPPNERYYTSFIGPTKMYMPIKLIKKYLKIIKTNPIIK